MTRCAAIWAVLAATGAAAPASAQWWWPPSNGMLVSPQCPSPGGSVTLAFSGQWPDACVPNAAQVVWNGGWLDVRLSSVPEPGNCLSVITPWVMTIGAGPLPEGSYPVYATYYRSGQAFTNRVEMGSVQVSSGCPVQCYPNCDGSTTAPALNVMDFACFLHQFETGNLSANCDSSTAAPVLNVMDFACFITRFGQGCP
jgi:hypothetical protein